MEQYITPRRWSQSTPIVFWFESMPERRPPPPTEYREMNKGFLLLYALSGTFDRARQTRLLRDLIARFCLTYDCTPAPIPDTLPHQSSGLIYRAGDLIQTLDKLKTKLKPLPHIAEDYFQDELFWCMKLAAEERLQAGLLFDPEYLVQIGRKTHPGKNPSTYKAKAKSIFNWYDSRSFQPTPTERESTMTRPEAGYHAHTMKRLAADHKIEVALEKMRFLKEKITVAAVARNSGVTRPTVMRYRREHPEKFPD